MPPRKRSTRCSVDLSDAVVAQGALLAAEEQALHVTNNLLYTHRDSPLVVRAEAAFGTFMTAPRHSLLAVVVHAQVQALAQPATVPRARRPRQRHCSRLHQANCAWLCSQRRAPPTLKHNSVRATAGLRVPSPGVQLSSPHLARAAGRPSLR